MPAPASLITYVELPTTDLEATKGFYTAAFGWGWVDYGPTYAASTGAGIEVALSAEATPAEPHDPGEQSAIGPFVLLSTDDLDATEVAVVAAGGDIVTSPYSYPGGSRFHFSDPSGNILGVYHPS